MRLSRTFTRCIYRLDFLLQNPSKTHQAILTFKPFSFGNSMTWQVCAFNSVHRKPLKVMQQLIEMLPNYKAPWLNQDIFQSVTGGYPGVKVVWVQHNIM